MSPRSPRRKASLNKRKLSLALAVCVAAGSAAYAAQSVAAPRPVTKPAAKPGPRLEQFVQNPYFTHGVQGWKASAGGTSLRHVYGGRARNDHGPQTPDTARVVNVSGSTVVLNDARPSVAKTVAGGRYVAHAWVRAQRPGVVGLRVMEFAGAQRNVLRGKAMQQVSVGRGWQKLRAVYTARTNGAVLDLNIVSNDVARGGFLDADAVTLYGPPSKGTPTGHPTTPRPSHTPTATPTTPRPTPTVTQPTSTPTSSPSNPAGWKLKYATNFSSLSGWTVYNGQTQSNDNSANVAKNVTAGAQGLTIMGRRESANGKPFTSGEIVGKGAQVAPNYFRAEVTGTFKDEAGIWPCLLWFRPVNSSKGEIDVMEWMGGLWSGNQKRVAITMHNEYGAKQASIKRPFTLAANPWYNPNVEHTYTIEKVKGAISVWIDGRKVAKFTSADNSWWNSIMEVQNRTWYPRITLQIGSGSANRVVPNPSASWKSTKVSVKSYKLWTK